MIILKIGVDGELASLLNGGIRLRVTLCWFQAMNYSRCVM